MGPSGRKRAPLRLALGIAFAAVTLAAPSASAEPQVTSLRLSEPPVVGQPLELRVRAVDSEAPVSGAVASFGREGSFGTSACYAPDSEGRLPGAPFAPGSPVTLSIPHTFTSPGELASVVRIDAGGCLDITGSVLQPFTVSPVPPGQVPGPIVLQPPVPIPDPGGGAPPPPVPGGGGLPPLPPLPPVPPPPPLPIPDPPPVPDPPPLPVPDPLPRAASGVHAARTACPGAGRRVRNRRRSRKQARKVVLCLLNRERRKRGLQPLRHQRRLFTASFRHSRAMVRRRFFSHVQPGGIGLLTRLVQVRYLPGRAWGVGENIAWGMGGYETPRHVVRAWMHSTGHRANILNPAFREIGIGVYSGSPPIARRRGATYTTDFGFKR